MESKVYFYQDTKHHENFRGEYFESDSDALAWATERKSLLAPEHAVILFTNEDWKTLNADPFFRIKRSEYRVVKEWEGQR